MLFALKHASHVAHLSTIATTQTCTQNPSLSLVTAQEIITNSEKMNNNHEKLFPGDVVEDVEVSVYVHIIVLSRPNLVVN